MQRDNLPIAIWYSQKLKERINKKFNQMGWFICKKDHNGIYNKIVFGNPITFNYWIEMVKDGIVFFDSGMYEENSRPYSQWRANNITFDNLIVRCYPPFNSTQSF